MVKRVAWLALAAFFVTVGACDVTAQQPTQQQRDAIRAACRSDFMTNCSGVQPGGKEALACLVQHRGSLSAGCKTAVDAIASAPTSPPKGPPAGAAESTQTGVPAAAAATPAPSSEDQLKTVQQACTLSDLMGHCSWIAPSSPELLQCLKANPSDLSPPCLSAVKSLEGASSTAAAPAPAAPRATAAKPAEEGAAKPTGRAGEKPAAPAAQAPPQKPTEGQISAVRSACRADFMAHCRGVKPGGSAALACLKRNAAHLSAGCQSAVAALGQGAEGAAVSAAAPAASTRAPLGAMPMLGPREALTILRHCGGDRRSLCPGVEPGGGRLISCLAEHASAVSSDCYAALSTAAGR